MFRSSSAATTGAGYDVQSTSTATSVPIVGGLLSQPAGHLAAHTSEIVPELLRRNTAYTTGEKFEYALGIRSHFTADADGEDCEQLSRYVLLSNIHPRKLEDEVNGSGVLNVVKNTIKGLVGVKQDQSVKDYLLRFDNINNAYDAVQVLLEKSIRPNAHPAYLLSYITSLAYHQLLNHESPVFTNFEAEVYVLFRLQHYESLPFTHQRIRSSIQERVIRELQSQVGGVWKTELIHQNPYEYSYLFRVEMDSVTMADKAVQIYGQFVQIFHAINSRDIEPLVVGASMQVSYAVSLQDPLQFLESDPMNQLFGMYRINYDMNIGGDIDYRNVIDVGRILAGYDARTTIMLRNIPNKLGMFDLVRLLNSVCPGHFDFAYLRVDFQNQCNVGYAFINFDTPADIVLFCLEVVGHRWNMFNSEKVAMICYATIQGKDALIDRFRNSGVMAQWAPFRAQLFYTEADNVADWMQGEIAPFPPPNNQGRLRRSLQNVRHVGLFPPRNGGDNHLNGRRGTARTQPRHIGH